MDFVHDQLAMGRKIRVLTVVDTFTRYVPVLDPRFSYRGEDGVQTLERVCTKAGYANPLEEFSGNRRECGRKLGPDGGDSTDDDHSDQGRDDTILDSRCAFFVADKALDSVHGAGLRPCDCYISARPVNPALTDC